VKASWIDAEVVFDRPLATGADLDVLQEVLLTAAPKWTSKLRLRRGRHDERSIDATQSGTLKRAILSAVTERGSTFEELVKRHGRPEFDRLSGSAELRGTGPELVVIVSIDEWPVSPLGTKAHLGNSISLQVRRRTVEGRKGDAWTYEISRAVLAEFLWQPLSEAHWRRALAISQSRTDPGGRRRLYCLACTRTRELDFARICGTRESRPTSFGSSVLFLQVRKQHRACRPIVGFGRR
jgi:hypothetical protein